MESKRNNINKVSSHQSKISKKSSNGDPLPEEEDIGGDDYEYDAEYNDGEDYEINVDEGTSDFQLEALYQNAEKEEDPISAYEAVISMDDTPEKKWAYKSYEAICLIYIKKDDSRSFHTYYQKLFEIGKYVHKLFIQETVGLFVKALIEMQNSGAFMRWMEELELPFGIENEDPVKIVFEAALNLHSTKLQMILENDSENVAEEVSKFSSTLKSENINAKEIVFEKHQLKELTYNFLIKECGISPSDLDERGNSAFYKLSSGTRGGEPYIAPSGWYGFGINIRKYGNNMDWIANDGRPGEWAVAFHGFGRGSDSTALRNTIKTFVKENLKPGGGQACANNPDARHPGKKCGQGVYVAPNINVALGYSGRIKLGKDYYNIIIMVRCKPDKIRCSSAGYGYYAPGPQGTNNPQNLSNCNDYWILDGTADQLRPYRILLKKFDNNAYRY